MTAMSPEIVRKHCKYSATKYLHYTQSSTVLLEGRLKCRFQTQR